MSRLSQVAFVSILALAFGQYISTAAPSAPETVTLTTPLDSQHATTTESTYADLVADSALASASNAQIALIPADETRPTMIDAGKVPITDLVKSLRASSDPSDTVVVIKLTGTQVVDALNHGVSRLPSPYDGFLQVSGLTVTYSKDSIGAVTVSSVTLPNTGATIQPTATYLVAMPKYMADGAFGYFSIWPSTTAQTDTQINISDAVTKYATTNQPLTYNAGNRISGE